MYLGLLLFIFSSPLLNQATTLYHPEYTESTHLLYKSHIPWIKVYPGKTVSKEIEEAVAVPEEVTGLKEFVALVFTGEANVIRGVFVPDLSIRSSNSPPAITSTYRLNLIWSRNFVWPIKMV